MASRIHAQFISPHMLHWVSPFSSGILCSEAKLCSCYGLSVFGSGLRNHNFFLKSLNSLVGFQIFGENEKSVKR